MNDNYNYPLGADNAEAPWNEEVHSPRIFNITVSQTLSKTVPVSTDDYNSEITMVDGIKREFISINEDHLEDIYHENDLYTPLQLIELFKKYLQKAIGEDVFVIESPSHLKHLIENCNNWIEDEKAFIE